MQASKQSNVSPRKQYDTPLSEQRRKFIAKQRAEQELGLRLSITPHGDSVDRIHRHARKNLSGKTSAVKPRRRSKHEHETIEKMPEVATSCRRTSSIANSQRAPPRLCFDLDSEFPTKGPCSSELIEGSDRFPRRKKQNKMSTATESATTVVTPQTSPRPIRRRRSEVSSINVNHRQKQVEKTVTSALHSKLGLDW